MVSGVSSTTSNYSASTTSSSSASESRRITRQIEQLEKELEALQENDQLDEETKAEQMQLYETQILQLQMQLANIAVAATNESSSSASVQTQASAPAGDARGPEGSMMQPPSDGAMRPQGMMQPPPPMSFENMINNMSDEDLVNMLKDIQEKTGSIPGVEGGVDLDNISSDELQELRQSMIEDMQNKMQPPPEMRMRKAAASYGNFQQIADDMLSLSHSEG